MNPLSPNLRIFGLTFSLLACTASEELSGEPDFTSMRDELVAPAALGSGDNVSTLPEPTGEVGPAMESLQELRFDWAGIVNHAGPEPTQRTRVGSFELTAGTTLMRIRVDLQGSGSLDLELESTDQVGQVSVSTIGLYQTSGAKMIYAVVPKGRHEVFARVRPGTRYNYVMNGRAQRSVDELAVNPGGPSFELARDLGVMGPGPSTSLKAQGFLGFGEPFASAPQYYRVRVAGDQGRIRLKSSLGRTVARVFDLNKRSLFLMESHPGVPSDRTYKSMTLAPGEYFIELKALDSYRDNITTLWSDFQLELGNPG